MNEENRERIKRLAKVITIHGYRNSPIEDIHASGRISDEEMKHLNKTIYSQIYTLMVMMFEGKMTSKYWYAWGDDWDEPELLQEWFEHEKEL